MKTESEQRTTEHKKQRTDSDLMEIVARDGERAHEAYSDIYDRCFRFVRELAHKKLKDADAAEMIAAETMSRLWQYRKTYENRGLLLSWLAKIADGEIKRRFTNAKPERHVRTSSFLEIHGDRGASQLDILIEGEERQKIVNHLDLLCQSLDETLDDLGMPLHTNRWLLAAGRDCSKTEIARSEGISFEKYQKRGVDG